MRFSHVLIPFFVIAGALSFACSDDSVSTTGSSSTSGAVGTTSSGSTGRPNGGTSGSSGIDDGPYGSTSSSSGYPGSIDLDSIITITASSDVCGKPAGYCYDAQAFTVDFVNSKVTNTTCVEVGGGGDAGGPGGTEDAKTSRSIDKEALTTVRQKLANLKTSSEPVKGYDGPIKTLAVVTKNSTVIYSPDAGCGEQDKMVKIVSGWDELWDSLRAL